MSGAPPTGLAHLDALERPLRELRAEAGRLTGWGNRMTEVLLRGGRVLAAGNGGSAAEAQHLTAELVGRYHGDRLPLSAICLSAESSSVTAIANDYGFDEVFARQVRAHGRPGDVLVAFSTSGRSSNVLGAAEAAAELGIATLALTGARPNPLAERCDDALVVDCPYTPTVQEVHMVAVHLLCAAVEAGVAAATDRGAAA